MNERAGVARVDPAPWLSTDATPSTKDGVVAARLAATTPKLSQPHGG